jgi:hypothetical protein
MTRRFSFHKQILSEDVSCQQILFSSADFVSRFRQQIFAVSRFCFFKQISSEDFLRQQICFSSANVFTLVNKTTLAPFSFAPACFVRETLSPPAGAHCFRRNHDCAPCAGAGPSWLLDTLELYYNLQPVVLVQSISSVRHITRTSTDDSIYCI